MAQAMAEDPTVYEYDEVYDKIEEDRKKTMVAKLGQGKNKPKYITSLKKAAEQRQREYERVIERKVCPISVEFMYADFVHLISLSV